MIFEQRHEMQLETVHPSGAEEWWCPSCGRRFIAQWEPKFRRVILQQGDEKIAHVGQAMGQLGESFGSSNEATYENGSELQDVWKQLLDKLDFGEEGSDSNSEQGDHST